MNGDFDARRPLSCSARECGSTSGAIRSNQVQTPESAGFSNYSKLVGICHVDDDQQVLIFDGAELIRSCPMSSSSEAEEQDKKTQAHDKDIYVVG